MPELPEVETTVRTLRPALEERTILQVRAIDYPPLVRPWPVEAFATALAGRRIRTVGRRGKYIVLRLDRGLHLAIHLRMTGRLLLLSAGTSPDQHTHAILDLDDGRSLHFHDPRKFGRMRLLDQAGYAALEAQLGPEPLDPAMDGNVLHRRLQRRARARLKPLLLDQHFLAGLGNIYADEALFRARLHPLRRAGGLSEEEATRLYRAIVAVLQEAIAAEGTTLRDGAYRFGEDRRGRFALHLRVYGRAGQPCLRCGAPIRRLRISGRSSHFCPRCQPLPQGAGTLSGATSSVCLAQDPGPPGGSRGRTPRKGC